MSRQGTAASVDRLTECTDHAERWLAAWTGNRPEKLSAFFHPEVVYRDPGRPDGISGIAALDGYLRALLAANPEWVWTPIEVMPTERGYTLKWQATIPTRAGEVVELGLDIVELDAAGLITRNEVYFDLTRLLGAG